VNVQQTWSSREWLAQAEHWIGMVLESLNLVRTGPLEQPRIRFWSTHLTVPTDQGRLWFKENNPGRFQEAAVVAAMADAVPEHVPAPLAIEPAKGWMLTPDHGATLAAVRSTDERLWTRLLTEFADLQKRLVPCGERLGAAGLATMDPAAASNFVSNQLLLHTGVPREHPLHLPPDAADRLHAQLAEIDAAAETLAAAGVPLTLQHNDLRPGNTFVPGGSSEPLRFVGFADAYWAHPFSSLLVPLRLMQEQWRAPATDPRIERILGAYLDCWTDFAPMPQLYAALDPALRLGQLQGYAAWLRLLIHADDAGMARYAPPALELLLAVADPVLVPNRSRRTRARHL
jgi:hypothetical protein